MELLNLLGKLPLPPGRIVMKLANINEFDLRARQLSSYLDHGLNLVRDP